MRLPIEKRKVRGGTHDPIHIEGRAVKRVSSFKFLGTHISENMSWTTNISSLIKSLFFLRTLKKNHVSFLVNFYRCAIESILTNCVPVTQDLKKRDTSKEEEERNKLHIVLIYLYGVSEKFRRKNSPLDTENLPWITMNWMIENLHRLCNCVKVLYGSCTIAECKDF
ncbi:hypothetical protein D4764_12G0008120 [Takifugu flavidus]|uniref:Alkylated DNA repair protein AlkB homologue 8 N-terminal domain-containing protein n=1 Tax=Takifugu flavidus TaxID=433684 RepID=A0A5C6PC94_9TELE|nr:hypothetical protein D4764_12G0008120 [Takifugu flavidus]